MKYLVVAVSLFFLSACHFDPSTANPKDGSPAEPDAAPASCADFVPTSCGDCGRQLCTNSSSGVEVLCLPDPSAPACQGDLSCNNYGMCEAEVTCAPGLSKKCGECGTESCMEGDWSGECVADDNGCDAGTLCLPSQIDVPTCQAACSTEGHRTPYSESGLNNGTNGGYSNGGPTDSSPIPDVMPVNEFWLSIDECYAGGYKRCDCEIRFYGADPTVECDIRCRYDD